MVTPEAGRTGGPRRAWPVWARWRGGRSPGPAAMSVRDPVAAGELVRMPRLGDTVTEATVIRWLVPVGEPVEAGRPLFEISTDKVDTEVAAPVGGVLVEIVVPVGATVAVGTALAVIAVPADGSDGSASPA